MEIITVISGTNRLDSRTIKTAKTLADLFTQKEVEVRFLSLEQLPTDFIFTDLGSNSSNAFTDIINQYFIPSNKFVFVVPEYNGSYPGIVKAMIDCIPPRVFTNKKAGIVGVSSGQAGNLRGQEHLTGVLHYLKVHVHYNKPKLSNVDRLFNENGELSDDFTKARMDEFVGQMIAY
jgi:NAD(P)H-dependent FMN reductase